VEVLVAMGLFGVLGTLLLGLALSTSQVTEDTRNLANVTEQSRVAMERMTRELRQAEEIQAVQFSGSPQATSQAIGVTFWTDFNGNKVKDLNAADPEVVTYRWKAATSELTLTANDASGTAITRPVLAVDVTNFSIGLRSSKWQYDKNADGITTWQELNQSGHPVGNNNDALDAPELAHIDLVSLAMTVSRGSRAQTYSTQVDLRNQD